nr:MAG: hypothetical protein TU35_00745 [Thermoproteus sp. AZ2]
MLLDKLYKELGRNWAFFSRALSLARSEGEPRYAPALAVAEASPCPMRGRLLAEDLELETFARALRDRVKYAVLLGLFEEAKADELTRRAIKGDAGALRALLRVGRDLKSVDITPILPKLREEFELARRAAGKVFITAARGVIREAAAYVKYAEVYPYAGAGVERGGYVFYVVAGVGEDHVYLFRVGRPRERVMRTASIEADVAAAAFAKRREKIHVYVPGSGIFSTLRDAVDPTPKFKAFLSGECRPGPYCRACRYKDRCPCMSPDTVAPGHRGP